MRKLVILVIILALVKMACSEKKDVFYLEKGSQSYDLAEDIATIFPPLDPDETFIMVETDEFLVTAGEAIHELRLNMGLDANKLKNLSAGNLKGLIMESARKLAEKKILLYTAEKSGINVSETEIVDALNRQYVQSGSEEKFLELIKKNGLDIEYVKNDIWKDLMIQLYLDEKIYSDIQIIEEEIRELYLKDKTATIRHILLNTQGKEALEKQEIREQMEEILKRAKKGADFAELAKKYSQDFPSKDKGGLYEDFGRGYIPEPLERAAFTIPLGEISDIIETPMGYHIIKVIERKKENRQIEEVREEFEARINIKKQRDMYHSHLEKLKQELGFRITRF